MTPVTTKDSDEQKLACRSNYTPYIAMSSDEKQVLLGTLIGDGYLQRDASNAVFLSLYHALSQKAYLEWKVSKLTSLSQLGSKIYVDQRKDGTSRCRWISRRHPCLQEVYSKLYLPKKTITRKYLNMLGPLGVAVWWMDDGYCGVNKLRRCRYGILATHGFSLNENMLIKKWFRNMYGIDCYFKKEKDLYCLRFNGTNLKRIVKLIKPYIPSCMNYKIDMQYPDAESYNVEFLPVKNLNSPVRNKI